MEVDFVVYLDRETGVGQEAEAAVYCTPTGSEDTMMSSHMRLGWVLRGSRDAERQRDMVGAQEGSSAPAGSVNRR